MGDKPVVEGQGGSYAMAADSPFAYGRIADFYEAADADGHRLCLKVFHVMPDGSHAHRWAREVQLLQSLQHPNILTILDHGSVSLGRERPFIVMPLLADGDLLQLLSGHRFMPRDRAIPILKQVASALDYAHTRGIVHGDVKPENILVEGATETVYLSDFGLSHFFAFVDQTITANVGCAGTADYQAPEQFEESQTTPESDIYAFGLLTCRVLTGALPFPAESTPSHRMFAKVKGELLDPRELLPDVDRKTARAILWALSVRQEARPPSATALIDAIESGRIPFKTRGRSRTLWRRLTNGERITLVLGVSGTAITLIATLISWLGR